MASSLNFIPSLSEPCSCPDIQVMFQRDAPDLGSLLALSTILDVLSPNSAHCSSQHPHPQLSRLDISPAMCIRVPAQVPVFPSSPCLAHSHTPSTPSYNSHLYSCPCYHKYAAPPHSATPTGALLHTHTSTLRHDSSSSCPYAPACLPHCCAVAPVHGCLHVPACAVHP